MWWKRILFILFLCSLAYFFLANKIRRKETRELELPPYSKVTAHLDVKGSLFWGLVVLEFQGGQGNESRHTKIELVATDLDAIKQIEWLPGNKAVVITLLESHDSAGDQTDKFFYDFTNNQFLTTYSGQISDQQFTEFVHTRTQQGNMAPPQVK
jgi:hypothetical protein